MILVTGDVHYPIDYAKLLELAKAGTLDKKDYLIVCGDFGVVWESWVRTNEAVTQISKLPFTVLWVDGNHENFSLLKQMPVVKKFGSLCHKITKNCFHLMRGNLYKIDGSTFFTFGGARSSDKAWRTPGIDWFPEEEASISEKAIAYDNLHSVGNKVDYIITHDCPTSILQVISKEIGTYLTPTDTSRFLQSIMNGTEFKHWFFGHHHIDSQLSPNITACYDCFYTLQNADVLFRPMGKN